MSLTTSPISGWLGIRDAKSHQQLDGQVFELTVSLLPGGRSRLHVDLDMQAADAMSYRTLMADLAALYQRSATCRNCAYSYREYRHESRASRSRAAAGLRRRPGVVVAAHSRTARPAHAADRRVENISRCNSTRRWHWLDPETRDALFATPAVSGSPPR